MIWPTTISMCQIAAFLFVHLATALLLHVDLLILVAVGIELSGVSSYAIISIVHVMKPLKEPVTDSLQLELMPSFA